MWSFLRLGIHQSHDWRLYSRFHINFLIGILLSLTNLGQLFTALGCSTHLSLQLKHLLLRHWVSGHLFHRIIIIAMILNLHWPLHSSLINGIELISMINSRCHTLLHLLLIEAYSNCIKVHLLLIGIAI